MREFAYDHDSAKLREILKDLPFFQNFSNEYLEDILFSSCLVEYDKGERLFKEGQTGSRIYILLDGKVEVTKGGKLVTRIDQAGEIFGEMALLGDETRSATITAMKDTLCLAVDEKFLEEVQSKTEDAAYYAALYGFLCRILAQRLSTTTAALAKAEKRLSKLKDK